MESPLRKLLYQQNFVNTTLYVYTLKTTIVKQNKNKKQKQNKKTKQNKTKQKKTFQHASQKETFSSRHLDFDENLKKKHFSEGIFQCMKSK